MSGLVRPSRSLSPRTSLGWSFRSSPRKSSSESSSVWIAVPLGPSSTRMRSAINASSLLRASIAQHYRRERIRPARSGCGEYAPRMRVVPTRDTVLRSTQSRSGGSAEHPPATLRRSVAALAAVPLFDGFSKRHLRRLAREADAVEFEPGRAIVEEGQAGEALFVVLTGTA